MCCNNELLYYLFHIVSFVNSRSQLKLKGTHDPVHTVCMAYSNMACARILYTQIAVNVYIQ